MKNATNSAMILLACATFALMATIYANIHDQHKTKTQRQRYSECIESTNGTDAECDSCFYSIHHVKP
jgi:hypothetical protein